MNKRITILVYGVTRDGKPIHPFAQEIENTLEAMQEIVDGEIEGWGLPHNPIYYLICHGEGKYAGLPPNRMVPGLDMICGTFFITKADLEGENVSLSPQEIIELTKRIP